jgi:casein kinase II subunit alpha
VKVKREIKILQDLRGSPNIVQLKTIARMEEADKNVLVFDYIHEKSFREYARDLPDHLVRWYMYQLLIAVQACHEKGIMHRDIKTHNIIINPETRELRLIDFGLAEYYVPKRKYKVRVASRPFKPPELLLGYQTYDYSLDMWLVG